MGTWSEDFAGKDCIPCAEGEHADDGTGQDCPCCGVYIPKASEIEGSEAMNETDWVSAEFPGDGLELPTDEERDLADAIMAPWAAQWGEEYRPIPRFHPDKDAPQGNRRNPPTNRAFMRAHLRRWWRKP